MTPATAELDIISRARQGTLPQSRRLPPRPRPKTQKFKNKLNRRFKKRRIHANQASVRTQITTQNEPGTRKKQKCKNNLATNPLPGAPKKRTS